jgi:hypothetical protein
MPKRSASCSTSAVLRGCVVSLRLDRAQPQRRAARGQRRGEARGGEVAVPALEREHAAVAELDDDLAAGLVDGAGQRG